MGCLPAGAGTTSGAVAARPAGLCLGQQGHPWIVVSGARGMGAPPTAERAHGWRQSCHSDYDHDHRQGYTELGHCHKPNLGR